MTSSGAFHHPRDTTGSASSTKSIPPIGHQNNLLVMGPGGLRFGDYWRLGLPLSLIVLAVGSIAIRLVWG